MSSPEDAAEEAGGAQYDAPNQQVVRPDGSGPADEGTGGSGGEEAQPIAEQQQTQETPPDQQATQETPPAARKGRGRPGRRDDDD